jgi:hypothetical protein
VPTVADCLRQHAPAYLKQFGDRIPLGHRKVISCITRCRTGALGSVKYRCQSCGREHWVGRSCGNRHCPNCGKQRTCAWLEKQTSRLLPVHYFLVTFTVPKELRSVLRRRQGDGYRALFEAAAESMRDVGSATQSLRNCRLGYWGVLHTWGRDPMIYHPHVHFVVPGGGVRVDDQGQPASWASTPENFLFHHGTLVNVYRAKLADKLRACDLFHQVPSATWKKKFVVDIEPVGDGRAVLKYLAPYVRRVAISDSRIVACDAASVTFRYKPSKSSTYRTRRVEGTEFVRGFLQHTLPPGFQKIRHYGWMSSNSRLGLDEVKWLVQLFLGWTHWLVSSCAPQPPTRQPSVLRCGGCGGEMLVVSITCQPAPAKALSQHALAYLDSG